MPTLDALAPLSATLDARSPDPLPGPRYATPDAPLAIASRDVDARLARHLAVELPLALARRHAADLLW